MKKKLLVTCLTCVTLSAGPVLAATMYIDASLGYNKVSDADHFVTDGYNSAKGHLEYKSSFYTSGALGVDFGQFRVEGEIGYAASDFEETNRTLKKQGAFDGQLTSASVMFNGYFDAENNSRFTPYVGLGFGFTSLDFTYTDNYWDEDAMKEDDLVMAHQVMIGLEAEINPSTSVTAEYRYFGASDPSFTNDFGETLDTEYKSNMIIGSVKFAL
ncbi:MAG: outer membrane beta-barrel protein [Desulfobulbaceae bacterium]|nr:outer membrane beta-barrel protein [Desulfobulbaceae bacterium]